MTLHGGNRTDMIMRDSTPHACASGAANQAGSSVFSTMKPALTFTEQVNRMRERGLVIADDDEAARWLAETNYYRLRGYWLTFERDGRFIPGTTLDDIREVYRLDEELRLWLWSAIGPVEIKTRTAFAYHMSTACGPTAFENATYFKNSAAHAKAMRNYRRERDRALHDGVPCVTHNMEKYGDLPLWAAVEIMTMGTVSRLYGNLSDSARYGEGRIVSKAVADEFGVKPHYLTSWLRHLTYIRNLCGHHSRVYNRTMTTRVALLKADSAYQCAKLFPTIVTLKRLYERSWPGKWEAMASGLADLIATHPSVSLQPMGFHKDWLDALA